MPKISKYRKNLMTSSILRFNERKLNIILKMSKCPSTIVKKWLNDDFKLKKSIFAKNSGAHFT